MTSAEFYSELAKKTGMSEADSRHVWDQIAEFIVDAVVSKCYRDGGDLEVPGIGTAHAEDIASNLPTAGGVQCRRVFFHRSGEFLCKLAALKESQRRARTRGAGRRAANNNFDVASFASALEKSPDLAVTFRKLIIALDSAPKTV